MEGRRAELETQMLALAHGGVAEFNDAQRELQSLTSEIQKLSSPAHTGGQGGEDSVMGHDGIYSMSGKVRAWRETFQRGQEALVFVQRAIRFAFAGFGKERQKRFGGMGDFIASGAAEEMCARPPFVLEAAKIASVEHDLEHAVTRRREAFGLVLHQRLGAASAARVLGRHTILLIFGEL